MTRREYLQSLKDQGKTKEEAIELTKQWEIDNKPTTEVEKPQATATDAAPVVASPTGSTESKPEDTSLVLPKEDTEQLKQKPEISDPPKKYVASKNQVGIPKGEEIDILEEIDIDSKKFKEAKVSFDIDKDTQQQVKPFDYTAFEEQKKRDFERGARKISERDAYDHYKNTGGDIDISLFKEKDLKGKGELDVSKNLVKLKKLDKTSKDFVDEDVFKIEDEVIKGSVLRDQGNFYIPVYQTGTDANGNPILFEGKPVAIKDEELNAYIYKDAGVITQKDNILPGVEVTASQAQDLSLLDIDEEGHLSKLKDLNSKIKDATDKKEIEKLQQEKETEIRRYDNLVNQNALRASNRNYLNRNTENIGEEKEIPNIQNVLPNSGTKYYKFDNDSGEFEIKGRENDFHQVWNPFSDKMVYDGARFLSSENPRDIATKLNNNYLNHGLGTIVDGKEVITYKNPVFKENGDIDYNATLEANGLEPLKDYLKSGSQQRNAFNVAMQKEGLSSSLTLGKKDINIFQSKETPEDIANYMKFVKDNAAEYTYDGKGALPRYYEGSDKAIKQQNREIDDKEKGLVNKIQDEQKKGEEIIDKYKENNAKSESLAKNVTNKLEATKSEIEDINKAYVDNVTSKREELKIAVTENPDNADALVKRYQKWEDKQEEKRLDNVNGLIDDYTDLYEKEKEQIDVLIQKNKDLEVETGRISFNIESYLNNYETLEGLKAVLRYKNNDRVARKQNQEFSGNPFTEIYDVFATQFVDTQAGFNDIMRDFARGINNVGNSMGLISEGEYNANLATFKSQEATMESTKKAIVDKLVGIGNDEKYSQKFADSLVGGTIVAFTQMAASAMGAPLGGLGAGFFLSSMSQSNVANQNRQKEYVKELMENGVSRKDAIKRYEESYPKSRQMLYAYTQAAVEGALSHLSGKILSGKIPGKTSKDMVNNITNHVLRKLTNGNVTAREVQIAVNKYLGDSAAKVIRGGKKFTTSGLLETIEETTQFYSAIQIDEWFQNSTGDDINFDIPDFDSPEFKKQLNHMMQVSFLSGAGGTAFTMASSPSEAILSDYEKNTTFQERQQTDKLYEFYANTARDADALQNEISKISSDNTLSDADKKQKIQDANETYNLYNEIDDGLNGRAQMQIAALLQRKKALENKKKNLAKGSTGRIDKQIEAINNEMADVSGDSNNAKVDKDKTVSSLEEALVISTEEKVNLDNKDIEKVIRDENPNLTEEEVQEQVEANKIDFDPKQTAVRVFSPAEAQSIADEYGIDVDQLVDENGEFRNEGSYIPSKGVILLSQNAAEGVDIHEGTHLFTDIAFSKLENKNIVYALADKVMNEMRKQNPKAAAALERQLDKYREDENYDGNAVMQEVMPFYTQLREMGLFDTNNSVSRQLKRGIRRLYQNLGMKLDINENNILEVLNDYADNLKEGNVTKAQKRAVKGEVDIDQDLRTKGEVLAQEEFKSLAEDNIKEQPTLSTSKTTRVVPIKEPAKQPVKMVASKPISVDTRSMSNSFDQNITEDLVTNEDFKNSEAAIDAFENIENNSQFNNYINQLINRDNNLQGLDSEVKQEVNRKIKENLQLRALNNFKPIVDGNKRSLFSYLYGKADQRGLGGIAQKALLDVKKDYATRVDSDARSIDKPTSEGQTFDIEDTSTDIIAEVDRGVKEQPKSTFRRNIKRGNEKGLTQEEVKSFKEISEPIVSKLPPVSDPKYRTRVDQLAGAELKNWVKDNVLKGQDYKTFVRENYNNIRDLDLKYLIELDKGLMKQGKPRMFTKPNRRLTTQADIRKYRDSGRAFVENEAQGVMLYDILNPGADAAVDFFTKEKASTVSNRKGKLAEAFGKKMFKDFLPESRAKQSDTDQVKATSARKTQTRPDLLFSKKLIEELKEISTVRSKNEVAKILGFDASTINEKGRPKFLNQMLDAATKGQIDLATIQAGLMTSGGKETFYGKKGEDKKYKSYSDAIKAGVTNPLKYAKRSNGEFVVIGKRKIESDGKVLYVSNEKINKGVKEHNDYIPKTGRLYWGAKDPNYLALVKVAKKSPFNSKYKRINPMRQGLNNVKKILASEKSQEALNMDMLDHVVNQLSTAVNGGMSMDVAGLIVIQSYQATSGLIKSAAPFKYISSTFEKGKKLETRSTKLYREEHNPPASVVGASILTAIKMNKPKSVMKDIRNNFYQTILSKKDDSLLDIDYASTLPDGTYIGDNPIIRMAMAGINLNTVMNIETGKSIIDEFGLGVAETVQTFPGVVTFQNKLASDVVLGRIDIKEAQKDLEVYTKFPANGQPSLAKTQNDSSISNRVELKESKVLDIDEDMNMETLLSKAAGIDEALRLANSLDQPVKKIRVFDFDDTLARSNNKVYATRGEEIVEMNAEKFASDAARMIQEGWTMDFSDFNRVTDGERGPLFEVAKTIKEARGNEDLFVLTARGPEAQQSIYDFLKAEGLEFKKENIIGLGKSPGEAKANWILDKAAEGYNDFYFADDAYQNVKAVRDVMSVIDVKSKVQQARVKESKKLSDEFNDLIDETTGIDAFKEYSAAKAKTIGASKGNFKFFIPYSAEDFLGLVYPTLAKGSKGDAQMAWYKTNLIDKYTKAQENLSTARLNLMNDFKQLKKSLDVPKDLKKKNSNGFTNEQAVRVYLWNKADVEIPGLSKRDLKQLSDTVQDNPKLREFAEQILSITKGDGYAMPDANWLVGTITTDLINLINTEKRSKYLTDWQESVDAIYSKENLNKLEAIYGTKYVEALTNMLTRMKTGKNRLTSGSKIENRILDYVNGSIGTIMFFNTRSAVLQTISSINFVNWSFNNPYQAGKAFANQKQYWSDFKELMNSDYLLDRRNGLKLNISESEIADAAATSKNKAKAAINYLLQKGFLPTQYADSFAIASGGATFYRNRIKDLVSKGMTEVDAKKQALIEFRQVAEESQQSSDPSRISQQQASNIGRLILAFANTPMQYARIQKRAIQDLINGRGDAKSHVSRIVYYGFVQNVIFNALQQAVFALGFGDDDDDEKEEAKNKKYLNVANGMLDSLLRGLGIGGAAVSVAKNFLMDIYERSGRDRPEYVDSVWEVTRFSPPIYSKLSKLKQAGWQFDSKKRRELIYEKGFSLDNPAYEAAAKVVSATTNIPLDRVMYKIKNIEGALDEDNEIWQRVAMMGGWPKWQLEDPKTPATLTPEEKTEKKANTKIENYKKAKGSKDYDTIKKLTSDQQIKMLKGLGFGEYTIKKAKSEDAKIKLIIAKNSGKKNIVNKKEVDVYKYKKLSKADQVRKLDSLGLSKEEIKALKYENDRVEKLLELMK
jgi:hypothetical protein